MPQHTPENWLRLSGPANWFRLWTPPDWTTTQANEQITLSPTDESALLQIYSAWSREAQSHPIEDLVPPEMFFDEVSDVRRTAPLTSCIDSIGFEGLTRLNDSPASGAQQPRGRRQRLWRMWGLRQGPVTIVAILIHEGERDPELESRAAYILRTVEFHPHPADPPAEFAQRVTALARRKFPLLECELGDEFQLRLGQTQVNLANFYRSYVQSPDTFEQMMVPVLTTVVQVQEWGHEQSEPPLESVRDRIMPMLYPEETWREHFPDFVAMPWIAGLMVLYVVDEAQAYWFIRDSLLANWGISHEQLHEIAIRNLDDYFERRPMQLAVAGGVDEPRLVMPTQPDSYNAVRLLSESFRESIREVVGGSFAIGIPNRDFFVSVGLGSAVRLDQIREKIRGDHSEMDHPLCDELLLVTPDGVSALPADEA